MSSTVHDLLQSCRQHPEDKVRHNILADWYEEHGYYEIAYILRNKSPGTTRLTEGWETLLQYTWRLCDNPTTCTLSYHISEELYNNLPYDKKYFRIDTAYLALFEAISIYNSNHKIV